MLDRVDLAKPHKSHFKLANLPYSLDRISFVDIWVNLET